MCLDASAAFCQLLIGIEHIDHGAEIAVGQAGIGDPDGTVWLERDGGGKCAWYQPNIIGEIVDLVDVLSGGDAGTRNNDANENQA